MMQEAQEETQGDEDSEKNVLDVRPLRPPNKRKFETELEALKSEIQAKETELKGLQSDSQKGDGIASELKKIRIEKSTFIEKRNQMDTDLRALNQEITKKKVAISKLEVNLSYKSEARVDDRIRRLEAQLKFHNFKLSEEKKIVSEVNALTRSKKVLSQFLMVKKEFDEMKTRQKHIRDEIDAIHKGIMKLKSREEELRNESQATRQQMSSLKQEIDALYDKKRHLVAEHKKEEATFHAMKNEMRRKQKQKQTRKMDQEKVAKEPKKQDGTDVRHFVKPYQVERKLCSALTLYLKRFVAPSDQSELQGTAVKHASEPDQHLDGGLYLLKKKDDDDDLMFSGSVKSRASRRCRRDKRKSYQSKSIAHTPETLSQFAHLNLNAPSSSDELLASLEQLKARQLFYEQEAEKIKLSSEAGACRQESDKFISSNNDLDADQGAVAIVREVQSGDKDGDKDIDIDTVSSDEVHDTKELAGEEISPEMRLDSSEVVEVDNEDSTVVNEEASQKVFPCDVSHIRLKDPDIDHITQLMETLQTPEAQVS